VSARSDRRPVPRLPSYAAAVRWLLLLLISGCVAPADPPEEPTPTEEPATPEEPVAHVLDEPVPCGPSELIDGRFADDDLVADLLDALGLDRTVGVPQSLYEGIGGNIASDMTRLQLFHTLQEDPSRLPCFSGSIALRADAAVDSDRPLMMLLADAAAQLEQAIDVGGVWPGENLAGALEALGSDATPPADLPAALERALAITLYGAAEAAAYRDQALPDIDDAHRHFLYQGNSWLSTPAPAFGSAPYLNPDSDRDRALFELHSEGRPALHQGAVRLAQALDDSDWGSVSGDASFELSTPLGLVVVRGSGDDTHAPADFAEPILLLVDVGGDDTYLVPAGANQSWENPVALNIDLGGHDLYTYEEVPSPYDGDGLLPADVDGRVPQSGDFGRWSISTTARQGAGRLGYGFLLDLGDGDDVYRSLRRSQGYGGLGVGVLWDAGGNDSYEAEQGAQGSGVVGVGILVDRSGDDTYRSFKLSQAFALVSSVGLLHDGGGDDSYELVVDSPVLFDSPQTSGVANSSLGQGCAFGWRRDGPNTHLGGGLALLRDVAGNDEYEGSTFVQGSGYWMGLGILADADGDDAYRGVFYAQGATAHFALAAFLEGGGDDTYNVDWPPLRHSAIGLAHDWSVTAFIEDGGNDTYVGPDRGIGASKCHGLSLFVENGGDDSYTALHDRAIGWATDYDWAPDVCGNSTTNPSYAFFIDAGGADSYDKPDGAPGYGDGLLWINDDPLDEAALELSGGIDSAAGATWAAAYGAVWAESQ
jgi:hypothetical protein